MNFARNCPKTRRKSAILAGLFGCRDVAQPGSAPALGAGCRRFESCRPDQSRVWFNGRTEAFQASNAGSIPVTRSIKTPDQSLIGSGLFVLRVKFRLKNARCFRPSCVGSRLRASAFSAVRQHSSARAVIEKRLQIDLQSFCAYAIAALRRRRYRSNSGLHRPHSRKKKPETTHRVSGLKTLARPAGLEPATVGLEVRCSIR